MRVRVFVALLGVWTAHVVAPASAGVPAPCDKMVQDVGAPRYRGTKPDATTLCRRGYVLSHNTERKTPDWVVEVLTASRFQGPGDRDDSSFKPDPDLVAGDRAELADYKGSGWQRGHMAPAADMTFSQDAMDESFYLSNMNPQSGSLNGGVWGRLEDKARDWAESRGRIIMISGPIFDDTTPDVIGTHKVAVPTALYKMAYDPALHRAIGFIFPNSPQRGRKAEEFVVEIREIEDRTGIDFFSALPTHEENQIESIRATMWR